MYMPAPTSDFTPPPAGTHPARCYRVIDLGTQQGEWQGQPKFQRKILLSWELPTEPMDDGQPFSVHSTYTFSSSERALFRQHLEMWRGKPFAESDFGPGGFNVAKLIGVPCLLTVVHKAGSKGGTFANVAGISGMPKGMEVPPAINKPVLFSLERDEFDPLLLETLSDNVRMKIKASPEYAELTSTGAPEQRGADPELDDSIPF